jgi:hypothetical protein
MGDIMSNTVTLNGRSRKAMTDVAIDVMLDVMLRSCAFV